MTYLKIDNKKPFEYTIKQFKRLCEKTGIIKDVKNRRYYIKPTEKRKILKKKKTIKHNKLKKY